MAEHSCQRKALGHMVNSKYIASRYLEVIKDDPSWDASAMQKRINKESGADIHISKCYRAKAMANAIILGDIKGQYKRFCITIQKLLEKQIL